MSISLEIRDGMPWYLSTDIWTVPGDPNSSPGLPIVGTPCYLFARVTNNGTSPVQNATVNFYWANPALGFDRNSATIIGQANVSLGPGAADDVLCLTPWMPTFVNGGHECVLAEAFHTSLDPLPPAPAFNVPTDPHVAQRNLSVLVAAKHMFKMVFEVHNPSRKENTFEIIVQEGRWDEFQKLASQVGQDFKWDVRPGALKNWGFVDAVCPSPEEIKNGRKELRQLTLPPHGRITKCLVGEVSRGATFIHILQKRENQITGGLATLIISD